MHPGDHELLRQYANDGSQTAFAELVRRHVDLVYSAARRQVTSSALAEEIAQSVFLDLSRNAARIKPGTPIVAWLHVVTRRTAIDAIRREARRTGRENAAAQIAESTMSTPSADWSAIEPLLDEAVESLSLPDRTAVLLRFFENKSYRDIGIALTLSEDAAQKRVRRALDRLRSSFLRRGIAVTAAGLATNLSAHALHTAPVGLGTSVTATVGSLATQASLSTTATILAMTALEKSLVTCALVAALGGVAFEATTLRAQRIELAALRQRIDDLSSQARHTRQQRDLDLRGTEESRHRLAALSARSPVDLATEMEMNAWTDRVARLRQLSSQRPDLSIPELQLLPDDDWFRTARALQLETEDQIRDTFATLRHRAENAFINQLRRALRSYLDAHDGTLPENTRELAPFFDPPIEPAALDRYKMVAHGKLADLRSDKVIKQESPIDLERDSVWDFGLNEFSSQSALPVLVRGAIQAFTQANQGAKPTRPEDVQPYLPAPVNPAKLQPYLNSR
jgi:RNA polymerase sigma factor (sigma-70 family)